MSIISAPPLDAAAGPQSPVVRRTARVHHEKVLHPERFEGPLPRRREHITLIRWRRGGDGDWTYECVAAQFLSAVGQPLDRDHRRGRARVRHDRMVRLRQLSGEHPSSVYRSVPREEDGWVWQTGCGPHRTAGCPCPLERSGGHRETGY